MEKSRFEREQEVIATAKQKLAEELKEISVHLTDNQNKIAKFQKFLSVKYAEIAESKVNIKKTTLIEQQSKTQIDQHIEMLTWLIDSIDGTINDLQEKMIANSEAAIKESGAAFGTYVQDIEEIMTPLKECKNIKDQDELKQTIIAIAETLKIFSDGIHDSVDSMTEIVQKSNATAVDESTHDFDTFIKDIHQIFETFNSVLQTLKLTNSIKKYLDLEEIYTEINRYLDESLSNHENIGQLITQKANNEDQSEILDKYGLARDQTITKNKLGYFQGKLKEIEEELQKVEIHFQDLDEKIEFVQNEKITIFSFFQALSDEVVEKQNESAEIYNVLYATLDNINSTIPFIKSDLRNASEIAINSVIRDFTNNALIFGQLVSIIKKVEKGEDVKKMQNSISLIFEKSKGQIVKLNSIVHDFAENVKKANIEAVEKSFKEFNEFIDIFKQKFYIIQDSVSSITLSTSEQLIRDLEGFSEDEIKSKQEYMTEKERLIFLSGRKDFLKRQIQGLENELKGFAGAGDQKRRKVIKFTKNVEKYDITPIFNTQWNIKNAGIVPFSEFKLFDVIPVAFMQQNMSRKAEERPFNSQQKLLEWNISSLDKRETIDIAFTNEGIAPILESTQNYKKNITTPESYRYRNMAQPLFLDIIERDGLGAIIIRNPAESEMVWNIIVEFKETPEIDKLPNCIITTLKPQQSFVKKYKFKAAGCLIPKNFDASTKHRLSITLQRSTEVENEYSCEIGFENRSEFLTHITNFQVFDLKDLRTPIYQVKEHNLEILLPKIDFRKEFQLKTEMDPPNLIVDIQSTIQLVYNFDIQSPIDLRELEETPELESKIGAMAKTIKAVQKEAVPVTAQVNVAVILRGEQTEVANQIAPELQLIDEEISIIETQIAESEEKLKSLKRNLAQKQEERLKVQERLEKEKKEEQAQRAAKIAQQKAEQERLEEEKRRLAEEKNKLQELQEKIKNQAAIQSKALTPAVKSTMKTKTEPTKPKTQAPPATAKSQSGKVSPSPQKSLQETKPKSQSPQAPLKHPMTKTTPPPQKPTLQLKPKPTPSPPGNKPQQRPTAKPSPPASQKQSNINQKAKVQPNKPIKNKVQAQKTTTSGQKSPQNNKKQSKLPLAKKK